MQSTGIEMRLVLGVDLSGVEVSCRTTNQTKVAMNFYSLPAIVQARGRNRYWLLSLPLSPKQHWVSDRWISTDMFGREVSLHAKPCHCPWSCHIGCLELSADSVFSWEMWYASKDDNDYHVCLLVCPSLGKCKFQTTVTPRLLPRSISQEFNSVNSIKGTF